MTLGGASLYVAPPSAAGTVVFTGATRRRAAVHTSSAEVSVSILRLWVRNKEAPSASNWGLPRSRSSPSNCQGSQMTGSAVS